MIVESTQKLSKRQIHGGRKLMVGIKVKNGMASTSVCTLVKGDGKGKILWRGLGGDIWG